MKKTIVLIFVMAVAGFVAAVFIYWEGRTAQFAVDDSGNICIELKGEVHDNVIYPHYAADEGKFYFLLPSFVKDNRIYNDLLRDGYLDIDGKKLGKYGCFKWNEESSYVISYENNEIEVKFLKSANLRSVFITTKSGTMEYINAVKGNEETGEMSVVSEQGIEEYRGNLACIATRGQSTFYCPQKSYKLILEQAADLCGLGYEKKWNLITLYYQNDLIRTKITYDMANYIGIEYMPDCIWVDLYCNGNYIGVYLLSDAMSVGESRVDIVDLEKENENCNAGQDLENALMETADNYSFYQIESPDNITGGYLFEKSPKDKMAGDDCYFKLDASGYCFSLKSPSHVSQAEVEYIQAYMQKIENLIVEGDKAYWSYIDMDSFAKQFLIDKVAMESDAMYASQFYYKDADSDKLISGPLWDRDRTFGASTQTMDYNKGMDSDPCGMILWYDEFYQDDNFRNLMISYYQNLLPYIEELLETGIDDYVEMLAPARKMNDIVVEGNARTWNCRDYDNQIRYLKHFIAKRCNYLSGLWNIDYRKFSLPETTGAYHTVTFYDAESNFIESYRVKDGEYLSDLPKFDESEYRGWLMNRVDRIYIDAVPIYEDLDLFLMKK